MAFGCLDWCGLIMTDIVAEKTDPGLGVVLSSFRHG